VTEDDEGWIIQLLYAYHNHDLINILVGHPYVSRLTNEEKTIHIDMTNSAMKPRNILLTLKERNERNVTTIEQVYNAMTVY